MQDFFSTYSRIENPTWEMIFFSFILAFLLSGLIAFTYNATTRNDVQPPGMLHALIGGPVIATMILQSIGDNIASGLGMLGALTIVRYRTNLSNPRDAVFVFAALGIGISCGLYGFIIASVGTTMFCLISFVVYSSPFHFTKQTMQQTLKKKKAKENCWEAKIKMGELVRFSDDFIESMNDYCVYWHLGSITSEKTPSVEGGINERNYIYLYALQFKDDQKQQDFIKMLAVLEITMLSLKKDK